MCAKDTPYPQEVYSFPADTLPPPQYTLMTWKEVFQELQETRLSGNGIHLLPQVRDENGKPLVYTPQD